LKERFHTEAELIPGAGGVFDVTLDGRLVYSKHETGCFPDADTLIREIT